MKKFLTALLAGAMLLTGCGGGSNNDSGEVVFHDYFIMGSDFETLNYLNSSAAVNTRCFNQCISGLLDTDEYGNLVGDLAESWEHNEDYTVWTFHLRDGLTWVKRDGTEYAPVTAQDFVTALNWELDPANASTCTEMATTHLVNAEEFLSGTVTDFSTVGVKAPDEKTVVYELKIPAPWFETVLLYSSFYPLNADFIAEVGSDKFGNSPDNILYNGAYIMTEYTNDQEKVYEKNVAYWDVANVKVDRVEAISVKDTESTKELFERGDLDYCVLAGTQPIKLNEEGNEYMYQSDPACCAYVFFMNGECSDENVAKAMNNENFRKAIFYGWDRTEYVEQVDPLNPTSIFTWGYTPKGFVKASDGTDYTQLGDLAQWQENKFDNAKGREFMAKAVEELTAEGVTFPIAIPYWHKAGNETASNTAAVLKATLEECLGAENVTLSINEYTTSARSEVYNLNNQGIVGAGWVPDYGDPANQLGSVSYGPTGYMNGPNGMSHWNIPEFEAMFAEACAETSDIDARYTKFANAEAYLLEHAYYVPLYQANAQYRMTRYNPYSRTYSVTGGCEYRYKRIELADHILTAKEVADLKAEWLSKK